METSLANTISYLAGALSQLSLGSIAWVLLALVGALDLVSRFLVGLHDWRWTRRVLLFFGLYNEKTVQEKAVELCRAIVKKTYIELGLSKDQESFQRSNSWLVYRAYNGCEAPTEEVMRLLCEHIEEYRQGLRYGTHPPKHSRYYINTMEAALDDDKRRHMCHLLASLMARKGFEAPDFVIVPKDGNALLAGEWQKEFPLSCALLARGQKDPARAVVEESVLSTREGVILPNGVAENIEGLKFLLARAETRRKPLRGAVIDCNVSGGSQLLSIMKEFNKGTEKCRDRIAIVDTAFVLFRIDSHEKIDDTFQTSGFRIYRWFDLATADEIKKKIWAAKTKMWAARTTALSGLPLPDKQFDEVISSLLADVVDLGKSE